MELDDPENQSGSYCYLSTQGQFVAITRTADGEKRRRRRGEGRVKGGRGRGVEGKWWGWRGGAEGD